MSLRALVIVLAVFFGAGCVPPAARDAPVEQQRGAVGLMPSFAPGTTSPTAPAPESTTAPPDGTEATPDPAATTSPDTTASPPVVSDGGTGTTAGTAAQVRDPAGDVDAPALTDPPAYADLTAAHLGLADREATLRVDLRGGAPHASEDGHTMNVASFYDVDGDGEIDYEVWANLSPSGWGTSWFDNRQDRALYGADDQVAVEVDEEQLVLRFPVAYLGEASTFRWSLAAEWGSYESLNLGRMSQDYAPDDGVPAPFPG